MKENQPAVIGEDMELHNKASQHSKLNIINRY